MFLSCRSIDRGTNYPYIRTSDLRLSFRSRRLSIANETTKVRILGKHQKVSYFFISDPRTVVASYRFKRFLLSLFLKLLFLVMPINQNGSQVFQGLLRFYFSLRKMLSLFKDFLYSQSGFKHTL